MSQQKNVESNESASYLTDYSFEDASLARIVALSEKLGIEQHTLVNELVSSALGDAHDGFLSAYLSVEKRNNANQQLKSRVKEVLGSLTEMNNI